MGFSELDEESEAVTAAISFVLMPVLIFTLMLIEGMVLKSYYESAHPWARIFKEFKCNKKPVVYERTLSDFKCLLC